MFSIIIPNIYFNLQVNIDPFAGFEVLQSCIDIWGEYYYYTHLFRNASYGDADQSR